MKKIQLSDYTYNLPSDRIATHGLTKRDHAKLLHFNKGQIKHGVFHNIPDLIPSNSTLFFNNTKVIQARLILKRLTGASIEIFLLSPYPTSITILEALQSTGNVAYQCMIGNLKKWKNNEILLEKIKLGEEYIQLRAKLIDREKKIVDFSWDSSSINFSCIIEAIGHTPLPPYINRSDEAEDKVRYQTVYSEKPGAVAAPTAGLHFTDTVLQELKDKGVKLEYLTLHVSAGTFQPIKEENVLDHDMHSEQIIITRANLKALISAENCIAVGTTSMRTMESTYWYGVQLITTKKTDFHIEKLAPYQHSSTVLPDAKTAFTAVLDHMTELAIDELRGETEIFIFPGYEFKVCSALLTNFHQPGSTLILLVAAFIGENWREVYKSALKNNYRFLSFGDSSLLMR